MLSKTHKEMQAASSRGQQTTRELRAARAHDPGQPGPHESVKGLRELAARGDKYAQWRLRWLFHEG